MSKHIILKNTQNGIICTTIILILALNQLPSGPQLQHVPQMGQQPTSPAPLPPTTSSQASWSESSMPPPVMLSSCLPPVPAKLVWRIQDGLFVEMGELSPDRFDFLDLPATEQSASTPKVQEVTDITEWVQCSSVFTAIIHRSQPDLTPDLLGYQNLMVQTSLLCQEGCWVIYD